MTGGMAIVEALIANGVDTVFGLPGAQLYPLFDALQQRSDADPHRRRPARAGLRLHGVWLCALDRAGRASMPSCRVPACSIPRRRCARRYGCCAPVLCITGQVPSAFLGRGRGHLHELPDQLATLRSLTKWAARIERPADAPAIVNEAFRQMLSGRPGAGRDRDGMGHHGLERVRRAAGRRRHPRAAARHRRSRWRRRPSCLPPPGGP